MTTYTIAAASRELGISPSTIKSRVKNGIYPSPSRLIGKRRVYTAEELTEIRQITEYLPSWGEAPIDAKQREQFADELCKELYANGCQHNYDNAVQVLKRLGWTSKAIEILKWFRSNGGYCDCEIMLNVLSKED